MSNRYEVRDFDEEIVADAALLLAQRHRSHRSAIPARRLDYEESSQAETLITDLITQPEA